MILAIESQIPDSRAGSPDQGVGLTRCVSSKHQSSVLYKELLSRAPLSRWKKRKPCT
jgi:hypothetical protein